MKLLQHRNMLYLFYEELCVHSSHLMLSHCIDRSAGSMLSKGNKQAGTSLCVGHSLVKQPYNHINTELPSFNFSFRMEESLWNLSKLPCRSISNDDIVNTVYGVQNPIQLIFYLTPTFGYLARPPSSNQSVMLLHKYRGHARRVVNEVSIGRCNTRPTGHSCFFVGAEGGQACDYIQERGFQPTANRGNFSAHCNRVTHLT